MMKWAAFSYLSVFTQRLRREKESLSYEALLRALTKETLQAMFLCYT